MTTLSEFVADLREMAISSAPRGLSSAAFDGVSRSEVLAANERLGAAIARFERLEAIELEWLREAVRVARLAAEAFAEQSMHGNSSCA